jgi:UDP-N-acetylglucosamine/UDP-N-acetylgalactosamine 4-epimerase
MKKLRVLVTGGAGFIGSNIVGALVRSNKIDKVVVLDNLSTSSEDNIATLYSNPSFSFCKEDIRDFSTCLEATKGIDVICHQAALGSVPRSIADPITTHDVNGTGTLNIFNAAKQNNVKKIVFASSSSVYGDNPALPKQEDSIGNPLSPYAVTKQMNEKYAFAFSKVYDFNFIGLRYFNVFGPNQSPNGPYAAVIPLFILNSLMNKPSTINGDGMQSRDFTYVSNVVQANVNCIFSEDKNAWNNVYNVAYGGRATVLQLYKKIQEISGKSIEPIIGVSRKGDIPHSLADISKAKKMIGFNPIITLEDGLKLTFEWFSKK